MEYNYNIETVTNGAMVIVRLSLKRIKQWNRFNAQQCVRVRTPPLLRSLLSQTIKLIQGSPCGGGVGVGGDLVRSPAPSARFVMATLRVK